MTDPRFKRGYIPCPDCEKPMARHAFRCRSCTPLRRGENHYRWGGDAIPMQAGHKRARKLYRVMPEKCEDCGTAKATDRHHKDGVTTHNERDNISFLCRRCHMAADGRLERLVERNRRGRAA